MVHLYPIITMILVLYPPYVKKTKSLSQVFKQHYLSKYLIAQNSKTCIGKNFVHLLNLLGPTDIYVVYF